MSTKRSVLAQQAPVELTEAVRRRQEGPEIPDDSDRPGKEQQLAESTTARVGTGLDLEPGGTDPAGDLRAEVNDLSGAFTDDGDADDLLALDVPTADELRAELIADLTGGSSGGEGAGGAPPDDGSFDTRFGSKESLIGDGVSGNTRVVFDKDEGVRATDGQKALAKEFEGTGLGDLAGKFNSAGIGNAGQVLRESGQDIESIHTSKDGVVTAIKTTDGTTIVTNKDNGTTTTLKPDGSSTTTKTNPDGSTTTTDQDGNVVATTPPPEKKEETAPPDGDGAKDPGPDGTVPLPEELQAEIEADLERLRALKPETGDGVTDPSEIDDAAFGAGALPGSAVPDRKLDLIGNPGTEDLRTGGGSPPNPDPGTIDPVPGADDGPPATGPEDDPFDDGSAPLEPPAATGEGEAASGGGFAALPVSEIDSPVDAPPELEPLAFDDP
jgi:hypothetical protein